VSDHTHTSLSKFGHGAVGVYKKVQHVCEVTA